MHRVTTLPKLCLTVFLLLILFSDVCRGAALALPSSTSPEILPFISIPLVKLPEDPNRLGALGSALVHQMHVRRGVHRLSFMGSRSLPLTEVDDHTPNLTRRRLATSRRSHHAAISGVIRQIMEPGEGVQMAHAEDTTDSTLSEGANTDPEPKTDSESESDAEVTKSHNTTFCHSAGLDIEANDIGYLATLRIGTPLRPFRLLVDSGSADMWVGGERCQADGGGNCGDHKFLGEESSSSFRDTGKPWNISYGSGFVSGNMVTDHVAFAGLTLKTHTFGVAWKESAQFTANDIPLDGVLGCAKSTLSIQQTPTLVEALQATGLIERNIISYKIPRLTDGKNDGEIALGGMNPAKYDASSLVRVKNVNTGGFWEADLDAVEVNGEKLDLFNRSRRCILDTGTTLFIAPEEDVDAIHKSIPDADFDDSLDAWTVPCNTTATVSLVFGGRPFRIQSGDLAFLPVDPTNPTGACTSAIAKGGVNEGPTHWLVGDTFLKNVYLSTNHDTDVISIARLAN